MHAMGVASVDDVPLRVQAKFAVVRLLLRSHKEVQHPRIWKAIGEVIAEDLLKSEAWRSKANDWIAADDEFVSIGRVPASVLARLRLCKSSKRSSSLGSLDDGIDVEDERQSEANSDDGESSRRMKRLRVDVAGEALSEESDGLVY